jgi:hypothetical protein
VGSEPPRDSPPQPPQGASREEWREWRDQRRHVYWGGSWAWFWGVALILVGGYALLRSLGLLQWVRADVFWPLLVIALGVWLIIQRAMPRQPPR